MAAKSAGMPCPDYNRLHEGFKVAYTEMARQYPCFGFYNDAKHWWWRACVQYLFVKVKPFYKYGTWCLFFYVETWEGLVIQLLYNLFCSAGGLWCASCAENYFYLGWDKAERWLYGLFCLISMYELIWLNSAAIIIYYICYTNDAILLYENIFLWENGLHRRFMSSTGGVDVPITNGSRYEPAVMGAHHQRLAHASLPVYEPAVMAPLSPST